MVSQPLSLLTEDGERRVGPYTKCNGPQCGFSYTVYAVSPDGIEKFLRSHPDAKPATEVYQEMVDSPLNYTEMVAALLGYIRDGNQRYPGQIVYCCEFSP
ncbi:MAG: hypothetical protein K8U57_35810 [Planctomycetes bacterium]|nr:hypothetical protein [Planctomycetota bacterium]